MKLIGKFYKKNIGKKLVKSNQAPINFKSKLIKVVLE